MVICLVFFFPLITYQMCSKIPLLQINKNDYKTSETTHWLQPYFTRNEKHILSRPCGHSSSCHELPTRFSSVSSEMNPFYCNNELNTLSLHNTTDLSLPSSSYIIRITSPNGEYIYLPLSQKSASNYQSSSLLSTSVKN